MVMVMVLQLGSMLRCLGVQSQQIGRPWPVLIAGESAWRWPKFNGQGGVFNLDVECLIEVLAGTSLGCWSWSRMAWTALVHA